MSETAAVDYKELKDEALLKRYDLAMRKRGKAQNSL
jgi:hypothetical protein